MAAVEVTTPKSNIEALSKDEIINKYKGLLSIAKKAKQAKDELAEENRKLKESLASGEIQKDADKRALKTMQEMLEEFTANKLQLTTRVAELEQHAKNDNESLQQLRIENESLKRQLTRLNDDNDALLADIDRMEEQLKQVNLVGIEQRKHLSLLEPEVNKLKDSESLVLTLQEQLTALRNEFEATKTAEQAASAALAELEEKYKMVKEINTEQRKKFNSLKDRFIDVHRKLKKLKECKCLLLETQHEYYENVSKWQQDIVHASQLLCDEMTKLKMENEELLRMQNKEASHSATLNIDSISSKLAEIYMLSQRVLEEHRQQGKHHDNQQPQQTLDTQRQYQELQDLRANVTENGKKLSEIQAENVALREQLLMAEQQNAILEKQAHTWQEEITNYKQIIKEQTEQLQSMEKLLNEQFQKDEHAAPKLKMLEEIENEESSSYKQQIQFLNEQFKNAEQEAINWRTECTDCKQQLAALKEQLQNISLSCDEEKQQRDDLQQQLSLLQKENTQLSKELEEKTRVNVEENEEKLLQYRQSFEELKQSYTLKEREHKDLLDEMRELNEILKTRGDVISRQQEKQQELQAELKQLTVNLKQTEEKLAESQSLNKEQKQQHNNFNLEMEQTQQRIKELELQLRQSEEQLHELQAELQTLRNSSHNADFDAQSDVLSTASAMSRNDELARLRDVEDSFEDKYNKLRSLAVKLKRKLQEQTAYISEMDKQRSDNQSNNAAIKTNLDAAEQQVEKLQAAQEQMQKQIDSLKAENQKLKSSRKQTNVLNLEIEAAEKSLNEVTAKLALKNNELEAQRNIIDTQENNIRQLRQEIAILESAKEAECVHSKDLKQQIDLLQTQVKDAVHNKQTAVLASKELEQTHEELKLEAEDLRLQLANAASKYDATIQQLQTAKTELTSQLQDAQNTIQQQQQSIKTAERSLEDMRVEYLEYKVKAQAVLRKNQSRDSTREQELEEELQALRQAEEKWHNTAKEQIKRIEESDKQIETLSEDNANLQSRNKELLNVIEELRQQYELVSLENQRMLQTHQETLRQHRQHIEQLDECHKRQLQELSEKQQQQIEHLKAEHARAMRVPPIVGGSTASNLKHQQQHHHHTSSFATPLTSDQSKIDFLLMEREDAEGSEEAVESLAAKRKISNASRRSQLDFMPLDELLNAPMHTISDTVTTITAHSFGGSGSGGAGGSVTGHSDATIDNTHMELQATKERLHIQESRVRHLTALLAENEQDLAKLTQMNDMLKEELRRQERGVEREKHMHNSEYLKNVILKFLTLNNGDEKVRLVPVLNTILRLSRTEAELLNSVAKGQKGDRSWSSYLTAWTSGGGGGGGSTNNANSSNNN